ncbi:AraC family transcriptional regulator [Aestuariivivens sp. NBU2969]|uniref:AraC family transcriptional regulator n=1 Tax=Aestuariivivens sp. NBU2969 TaxID=2873267 RepID=UPI001CBB5F0F|nr:AraC family transcriptional regulator [Aestuariivivens sp. NBU2969]
MKVLPFKIPKPEQNVIVFQEDLDIAFYDKLHQHEEIQISLIFEGEGTLIVGDSVNYYSKGDILVIGSNLPHVFKSDTDSSPSSHMFTLFFTRHSFGNQFFELEELKEVRPFFRRSKQGFKITSHKKIITNLFLNLNKTSKLDKLITLLQLLKIATKANYISLSSYVYNKKFTDNEGKRLRDVFEYTMNHFETDISLSTIASVANMTKNAFCKYFKKRTNKTYVAFLTELRIEHASKLLLKHKEMPVIEIAELSGYNNLSNFNRQFKSLKHKSPSMFRKTN